MLLLLLINCCAAGDPSSPWPLFHGTAPGDKAGYFTPETTQIWPAGRVLRNVSCCRKRWRCHATCVLEQMLLLVPVALTIMRTGGALNDATSL